MESPNNIKLEKQVDASDLKKKQDLENAFLEALDAAEQVMKIQENLQKTLQNGFFDLVCARYNMGQLRVSRLQWNDRLMDAITLVDVFENGKSINMVDGQSENRFWFMTLRDSGSTSVFENELKKDDSIFSGSGGEPREGDGVREGGEGGGEGEGAGLRRRRNKGMTGGIGKTEETGEKVNEEKERQSGFNGEDRAFDEVEESAAVSSTSSQKSKALLSLDDPLRWFGGLVSPGLKKAQSNFKEATSLAVEIANAQRDLKIAMARYMELKSEDSI